MCLFLPLLSVSVLLFLGLRWGLGIGCTQDLLEASIAVNVLYSLLLIVAVIVLLFAFAFLCTCCCFVISYYLSLISTFNIDTQ